MFSVWNRCEKLSASLSQSFAVRSPFPRHVLPGLDRGEKILERFSAWMARGALACSSHSLKKTSFNQETGLRAAQSESDEVKVENILRGEGTLFLMACPAFLCKFVFSLQEYPTGRTPCCSEGRAIRNQFSQSVHPPYYT